jgi:uncharacterized CHY-type Zn-finger protein
MAVYCSKCKNKLEEMKQILPFEDKKGNQFVICEKCYNSMPTKDKKKLILLDKTQLRQV